MRRKQFISNLWKNIGKGEYFRVNKKDGSMPSLSEFKSMIQKNAN
jgi:hypothetical protein